MRRALVIAIVVAGAAWQLGWWSPDFNVPSMVTERTECAASYPTVCISPPPPHLTCRELSVGAFKVFGDDPHGFDPDGNGIGCD
jgi:hypothetical protein